MARIHFEFKTGVKDSSHIWNAIHWFSFSSNNFKSSIESNHRNLRLINAPRVHCLFKKNLGCFLQNMQTTKLNLVVLCWLVLKVRFLNFPAKTYQAVLRLHCNVLQGIPPHPCDHFGMKVLMGLLRWYEHWQAGGPHLEVYGPKIPVKMKKK